MVIKKPFPHVVIENALPEELHLELRNSFPSRQLLGVNLDQNQRWSTPALELRNMQGVTPLWRSFVEYHASRHFLEDVNRFFGEMIVELYPEMFPSCDEIRNRRVVVRHSRTQSPDALSLDSQISGNTPVTKRGAPRGIHVDSPNALWAGLYYLRHEQDDSIGGDLELWQWPEKYSRIQKLSAYREGLSSRKVLPLKSVPYRSNTLVFFVNSIDSLHSVTVRMPTSHTRQFLNLVCDVSQPLFVPSPPAWARMRDRVIQKLDVLRI